MAGEPANAGHLSLRDLACHHAIAGDGDVLLCEHDGFAVGLAVLAPAGGFGGYGVGPLSW